jgi:hypothetical protein
MNEDDIKKMDDEIADEDKEGQEAEDEMGGGPASFEPEESANTGFSNKFTTS